MELLFKKIIIVIFLVLFPQTFIFPQFEPPVQIASISFEDYIQFNSSASVQLKDQWCWAACISMLFSYYDHPISQDKIVSSVFGIPINMPAGAGVVIANQLNKEWTDENDEKFKSILIAAYDLQYKIFNLDNRILVSELESGHPLIIGVGSHAVILLSVKYQEYPNGFINVVQAKIFDPWPGIGYRFLSIQEMKPMWGGYSFAATVRVVDIEQQK